MSVSWGVHMLRYTYLHLFFVISTNVNKTKYCEHFLILTRSINIIYFFSKVKTVGDDVFWMKNHTIFITMYGFAFSNISRISSCFRNKYSICINSRVREQSRIQPKTQFFYYGISQILVNDELVIFGVFLKYENG